MDQPKPENLFFFKGHQLKNSVMCKQYVKQVYVLDLKGCLYWNGIHGYHVY
jgi:hypothetical protein